MTGIDIPNEAADPTHTNGPTPIPRRSGTLLTFMLDDWQKLWNALFGEPKPSRVNRTQIINRQVDTFGIVYLLAALHQVDPSKADEAARFLADQWDAGDSMGEWIYQWRQELEAGQPLSLWLDPDGETR